MIPLCKPPRLIQAVFQSTTVLVLATLTLSAVAKEANDDELFLDRFEEPPPPLFFLHKNGVTVRCLEAAIGDQGQVNGLHYTKRARSQITTANAETTCTSGIVNMSELFRDVGTFNRPIGSWDTSSVLYMNQMFFDASSFDQPLHHWDTSAVITMHGMFRNAASFNQDLSGWCVSLIPAEPPLFDSGAISWIEDRPVWGTCP